MRVQSTSWIKEAYLNDFMKQPTEAACEERGHRKGYGGVRHR
jgi:hypothetical protein